jgi:hypothetical protein
VTIIKRSLVHLPVSRCSSHFFFQLMVFQFLIFFPVIDAVPVLDFSQLLLGRQVCPA